MNDIAERLRQFQQGISDPDARSLQQLLASDPNEILKGAEAMRLRTHCTSNYLNFGRDLDTLGSDIASGKLSAIKSHYQERLDALGNRAAVNDELYQLSWGPTKTPLYGLLLLSTAVKPAHRQQHFEIAKFYISKGVSVDKPDLSGHTALTHSLSGYPSRDTEFAQMMLDAGAEINHRNRYGNTLGGALAQVYNTSSMDLNLPIIEFVLARGLNIDIQDGDGVTPRYIFDKWPIMSATHARKLQPLIKKEDERRKAGADKLCWLCGRCDKGLLKCSRCNEARYCGEGKKCQTLDWPKHKRTCKAKK